MYGIGKKPATGPGSPGSCLWLMVPRVLLLASGFLLVALGGATAQIPVATGSGVTVLPAPKGPFFDITTYGAVSNGAALTNQAAINNAIIAAAAAGGGTVLIPPGTYRTYSIRLKSNVGLPFESPNSHIRAGVPCTGSARVAAIDCGTNSLRLLVADVDRQAGRLADVDRRMEIVRLGQGVDATGRLSQEALSRTLHALRGYARIIVETAAG